VAIPPIISYAYGWLVSAIQSDALFIGVMELPNGTSLSFNWFDHPGVPPMPMNPLCLSY